MSNIPSTVNGIIQATQYGPISFLFNSNALGLGIRTAPDRVRLDVITVDATMQETHSAEADITEHPVEQGADITDHIRPKLKRYTIDGIISNTPIGPAGDFTDALQVAATSVGATLVKNGIAAASQFVANDFALSRVKATFEKLQALVDAAQPIRVHTPLHDYPSMAIESVSIVRDANLSSGGIRFQMVCKEIRTVETASVDAMLPATAQPSKSLGNQSGDGISGAALDQHNTLLNKWFGKGLDSVGLQQMPRTVVISAPGGDT